RARGHDRLPDLRRYLDLVALGTVADVVPLREENRVLVAHGLRALERTERPGLVALKQTALVDGVSVRAIGFRLAPRLNAGGRLADARVAVELLTTESVERAGVLAAELEMHNAERRALEDAMVAEAVSAIEARREPHGPGNPEPTLVARGVDIEGVRRVGDPARPHLRLRLRQDGRTLPAIGLGLGGLPVRVGDRVDIVFRPRLARWQGTERLEAEVL